MSPLLKRDIFIAEVTKIGCYLGQTQDVQTLYILHQRLTNLVRALESETRESVDDWLDDVAGQVPRREDEESV